MHTIVIAGSTRNLIIQEILTFVRMTVPIRNTVNHWIASGCALAMTDTDPFEAPSTFQIFFKLKS
jgi:hypothetical protein